MCGILGFNWKDKKLAIKLAKSIKHRGPDQEGFYFDKNISLGHTRLSILDLSKNGNQPMTTTDKNFTIVFNGEIYNYKKIKKELVKKKYNFKSTSDTEVLLCGYKEYGCNILKKLNGQFAFAIYDKKKQEIFLARDRVGIAPLYYYVKDNKFIFGSELKIILKTENKIKINKFSFNYYLMYGHTPNEKSIIENAFKLPSAHYLIFSLKQNKIIKKQKYWDVESTGEIRDEKKAKKLILKQLNKSIKLRMVADVPVGAFLSGGVDSSAIVALMSKYTNNLNTFSVKFNHPEFDESKYADIVSKKFNTKHHTIEFNAKNIKELIPKLIYHYDEPFADPSMVPMFLISHVAKQYVTVSLSGDGGDELFAGYSSYLSYQLIDFQKYFPKILFSLLYSMIKNKKGMAKLKKFFTIGTLNKDLKYAEFKSFLYREEFKQISNDNPIEYYKEYIGNNYHVKGNYIQRVTYIDIKNYMINNCMTKVDRASLGNGLETRPPILDYEMIELAAKIHPNLKIKNKETKYIFKKALAEILPDKILYRTKKGFGIPLKYYLKNDLKDLVEKYVINYNKHNLYKKDIIIEIKKIINLKKWPKDYSRIIWAILIFNIWYDKWILKKI